jgi:hypothetical protein
MDGGDIRVQAGGFELRGAVAGVKTAFNDNTNLHYWCGQVCLL